MSPARLSPLPPQVSPLSATSLGTPIRLGALALGWFSLSILPSIALARDGAVSATLLLKAQAKGRLRVIAQLDAPARPEGNLARAESIAQQRETIASSQRALRAELHGTDHTIHREFETIPFVALEIDPSALVALERSGRIIDVQEDRAEHVALAESVSLIDAPPAWASGLDGSGKVVAIVDTGVDSQHPALAGQVIDEACFSSNGDCPNGATTQIGEGAAAPCAYAPEGCSHGTHVAGIAAGRDSSAALGVAPGAKIMAIQVFSMSSGFEICGPLEDPCAVTMASDQIAALERVLALRSTYSIAAVNLSLGGGKYTSQADCDVANTARKAVIDHLSSFGIATVAAAGNEGFTDALIAPACISSAVSVGATTKQDTILPSSNSAPFLSLLAPGSMIHSSIPGGSFGVKSGTSMAAPHVAGAWAILKQKAASASVSTVLGALRSTGLALTDSRNQLTTPRISVARALDALSTPPVGLIEVPGTAASGIGQVSGWVCAAQQVTILLDNGTTLPAAYGTPRADTRGVCGDQNNGFAALFNFGLLGPGDHSAVGLADGVEFHRTTFRVGTLGTPFLRGARASYLLPDFAGRNVRIEWQESQQNFVILGTE